MEPADGAVDGAVILRRNHWRGALLGAGLVVGAGLLVLFAPAPAHADEGGGDGILGGVVGELTGVVDGIVSPVVDPLPPLGDVPVVASPHPSPLSASRGFFGSRPFSRVNGLLEQQGAAPVDWTLP